MQEPKKNTQTKERAEALKDMFGGCEVKDFSEWLERAAGALGGDNELEPLALMLSKIYAYCFFEVSLNTAKNKISEVREAVKSLVSDDKQATILNLLAFPLYDFLNKKREKKLVSQLENQKNCDLDWFEKFLNELEGRINAAQFLEVEGGKNERDRTIIYNKLLLVLMATGRRFIEILKTCELVKEGEALFYVGLAKKDSLTDKKEAYLLINDFEKIQTFIKEIRAFFKTDNLKNQEVNQKFSAIFNSWLKKINFNLTPKEIRIYYSNLAYKKFGQGQEKFYFFAKALGHNLEFSSLATTHYLTLS